jgi:PAS domain S-box-containing protein
MVKNYTIRSKKCTKRIKRFPLKVNSSEFFNYLSNTINESGKTDSQIANECNIGRVAVWKIRNNKTKSIRRDTLKKISKSLGMSYRFKGQNISFDLDTSKPIGGGEMANNTADKVIDHLMDQNQHANQRLAEMKTVIEDLKKQLHAKDELLLKNGSIIPDLDHSRMQVIVQLDKENPKFISMTTSYAQYLGYGPFELLGEPYLSTVHEDEFEKLAYFEKNPDEAKKENAWKMKHKDGSIVYIKGTANHIARGKTVICVIDIEKITEDEYIIATADSYYDPNNKGSA